jgi:hypothetical protein
MLIGETMNKPEILSFICPRCGYDGGGGVAEKLVYLPEKTKLFVCNECETTWFENDDLSEPTLLFISDFLDQKGEKGNFQLLKKYFFEVFF